MGLRPLLAEENAETRTTAEKAGEAHWMNAVSTSSRKKTELTEHWCKVEQALARSANPSRRGKDGTLALFEIALPASGSEFRKQNWLEPVRFGPTRWLGHHQHDDHRAVTDAQGRTISSERANEDESRTSSNVRAITTP